MDSCVFCMIRDGQIPSQKVYEDEYCVAFRDIEPQMPVHIVVASKRHVPNLMEFGQEDLEFLGGIQLALGKIAKQEGLAENGYRVIHNCGKDAMQSVPHLHYHILAGGPMGAKIV